MHQGRVEQVSVGGTEVPAEPIERGKFVAAKVPEVAPAWNN